MKKGKQIPAEFKKAAKILEEKGKQIPAEFKKAAKIFEEGTNLLCAAAHGKHGPKLQKRAREALQSMVERLTAAHALLMEVNESYREGIEKCLSKRAQKELMKESLRLNPLKLRNWTPRRNGSA